MPPLPGAHQISPQSGLFFSALMMALTVCLYREYHTLNIDEIMMKLRKEED